MWFVGTDLNSCPLVFGFFGFEAAALEEAAVLAIPGQGLSGFAGELVFRSLHHINYGRGRENMIRKKKKENIRESLDGRKKKKCFGCWVRIEG